MKISERPKKEEKNMQGSQACDLETQHVDKIVSSRGCRLAKLSPGTTVFPIAMQDQVISASSYKQHIFE
jgi:RecJ-like exonuclease